MKKNQKSRGCKRIAALLLAGLTMLTSSHWAELDVLAAIHVKTKDSPDVEIVNMNIGTDQEYVFTLEATENTRMELWGYEGPVLTGRDLYGIDNLAIMPTDDSLSGNIGCWYYNVGTYYGEPIDAKCTYYWNPVYTVDTGKRIYPLIDASFASHGLYEGRNVLAFQFSTSSFEVRYDLYCHGELMAPEVDMCLNFQDIDMNQYYGFKCNAGSINKVQCLEDATSYYKYVDGYEMAYAGGDTPISEDTPESSVRFEIANTNSFNIIYGTDSESYFKGEQMYPEMTDSRVSERHDVLLNLFQTAGGHGDINTINEHLADFGSDQDGNALYSLGQIMHWGFFNGASYGPYINPELSITKEASRYEWRVGDTVDYTVQVQQKVEGTTANRVIVSDLSIPEGLTLLDAAVSGVEASLEQNGNTWTARIRKLKYGQKASITFHCRAEEDSNGKELVNTAKAVADNAPEVQDVEEVYVNSAELKLIKAVSKYEWHVGDQVDYTVKVRNIKAGTIANNLTVSDLALPEGLELAGEPKVSGVPERISRPVKQDKTVHGETAEETVKTAVSSQKNGWNVSVSALPAGQEATIVFPCRVTEAANGVEIVNTAKAAADNAPEVQDVEEIYVNSPQLKLVKEASRYEWQAGDFVDYTVKVKNTKAGTIANHLTVSDLSLPEGLKLVGEPEVSGVPERISRPVKQDKTVHGQTQEETVQHAVSSQKNGWNVSISALPAGQEVSITFRCKATEAINGRETVNTVKAAADNVPEVQDVEEIYVNTAELKLTKEVSRYEWRVGEPVDYTVKVKNIKAGTIANKVAVSDLSLPEGLELVGEPEVSGVPERISRPVKQDKTVHGETAEETVKTTVSSQKNGWNVSVSALPAEQEVSITFPCKATEAVNGKEIINSARAEAENAETVKDDALIWVNTPGLHLEKTADIGRVRVGDLVTYTLTVTNQTPGTLAGNIVVEDRFDEESASFVKLQKNSIVLLDSEGNKIDGAKVSVKDNTFRIETGRSLVCPDGNYGIWNLEQSKDMLDGGKLNPEGVVEETAMTVEYQVKITGEDAAGGSIRNIATASSEEGGEAQDEEEVTVNGPHLDVEKTSDRKAYTAEETANYEITVRQTREGYRAKDVTITDTFEQEGMTIVEDSIRAKLNGKAFEPKSITYNEKGNGYVMETGQDLSDEDKLVVTYEVTFQAEAITDENRNPEYINRVAAKGSNTSESGDENTVAVSVKEAILNITKRSDQDSYLTGETAVYTLYITEAVQGASAKQVVLKDAFDKEGMVLITDSIVVKVNQKTVTPLSVVFNEAQNGYVLETGVDLTDQDIMQVTYKVQLMQTPEKNQATNTAVVKGTNTNEAEDDNTVKVTEAVPVLKTVKTAEKERYQVGDTGKYTITVTQTEELASAKQIILEDAFDTEGMRIVEDSVKIFVNGEERVPGSIIFSEDGNGYKIETGMDLTKEDVMTVTYEVLFEKAIEGYKTVNTAVVKGENTEASKDEETVTVVEPKLKVEKVSDREFYQTGETGEYTITVTQTEEGACAGQVILKDGFDKEGMSVVEDSIVVTKNGGEITPLSVTLNETKNGYVVETGADIAEKDLLQVTYQVVFNSIPEDGKAVNTVLAQGENTPEVQGENTVNVVDSVAELDIRKTVDKEQAKRGDTVTYHLTVKETAEDAAAEQVVIQDEWKHAGVKLKNDSVKIFDQDKKEITKDCKVTVDADGFQVETGKDLSYGEEFSVTYEVVLNDVNTGDTVRNIASASGNNAEKVTAEAQVQITRAFFGKIAETVQTGLVNHAGLYAGAGIVLLLAAVLFLRRRKGEKDYRI